MESADRLLSMDLRAGDADWSPTPHGHWLARMIAENDLVKDRDVLELGAGVANHTILTHRKGAKSIVATEITVFAALRAGDHRPTSSAGPDQRHAPCDS